MPTGRQRKMKGGFWNSLTEAWDKTKKSATDAYSSATGSTSAQSYTASTPSYTTPPTPPTPTSSLGSSFGSVGGKNKSRKRSRKMRGGYGDNIALTGLASSAASISDIKSSQPLNIVGGKRRTKKCRRNRNAKSCKRPRR